MGVTHPDDLRFAFRSERLVFRALEDNEADKKFIFDINNDPIATAMGSMVVLKPVDMGKFEKFMEYAKSCHLMAVACLPPLVKDDDGKDTEARLAPRDVTTDQLKDTTPIGFVTITRRGSPENAAPHRCGGLGITLMERFTGQGYGGEMINWILDWAFRRLNLHRVELGTWGNNANAIKLYRSLGFVEEGRDREALLFERKWVDILRFSMLEGEWEKLRGITSE
ncbi:acyl-CoA N-acyltransferase [Coniochaeta sp. PMI_546]|nr:acyl-CoA N-acyltransferase [Coniochaeta sp. PMI_546]